jgi:hypothetical protein
MTVRARHAPPTRNARHGAARNTHCFGLLSPADTHLRAIVSHFLQRNFKNISYVRGGYEGL